MRVGHAVLAVVDEDKVVISIVVDEGEAVIFIGRGLAWQSGSSRLRRVEHQRPKKKKRIGTASGLQQREVD